jgi:alpha-beta hydrolase superfamily lysophospholipase
VETDVLGTPYEKIPLVFDADDEGEVVATLVRRRAAEPTGRSVLYVHGYVDYFFQTHLADFYTDRGYDFYALDMRKYGRSLLPHQTPNFARDMSEYFAELDEAARYIRETDGHDTLLYNGHSTGGLIGALWAHRVRGRGVVDGLFLNSPFFDFNVSTLVRRGLGPVLSGLGRLRPYAVLPLSSLKTYGASIHRDHYGDWDFSLEWKPLGGYPVRAGWLRAVRQAHRRVHAGLQIDVPVLVACSAASFRSARFAEAAHTADAVLNVADIVRWAPKLGRNVTIVRIDGGRHDLTLSRPEAQAKTFAELDRWLAGYVERDYRENDYRENLALAPVRESQVGRAGERFAAGSAGSSQSDG